MPAYYSCLSTTRSRCLNENGSMLFRFFFQSFQFVAGLFFVFLCPSFFHRFRMRDSFNIFTIFLGYFFFFLSFLHRIDCLASILCSVIYVVNKKDFQIYQCIIVNWQVYSEKSLVLWNGMVRSEHELIE